MSNSTEFVHPLREWRKGTTRRKPMTLVKLAELTETTQSNLTYIETGVHYPSAELIRRLCDITKLKAEVFLPPPGQEAPASSSAPPASQPITAR